MFTNQPVNRSSNQLQPQLTIHDGRRVAAWQCDGSGEQLATGLAALGFRVSQHEASYLLHLDDHADALLLWLYDLTATLRWRTQHRQLVLFDRQEVGDV